jgi:hypothetical protein
MYTIFLLVLSLTFGYRSNEGGHLDPNGGRFAVRGDHRCTIDPNGGCVSALAGVRIDDNG